MIRKIIILFLLPLFYIMISCNGSNTQPVQEEFGQKATKAIEELKKQFPKGSHWEISPGDSSNSFALSSQGAIVHAFLFTDNDSAHDAAMLKSSTLYYLRPPLSSTDSIKMRKLQDSVIKASFALEEKYGLGIPDNNGHIKGLSELSPAQEKAFQEENAKLEKLSPVMPAFSSSAFSIYIVEPIHNLSDKAADEYELLQYGIANYFRTGKFNYDELLKYRKEEQEELKRKQSQLNQ